MEKEAKRLPKYTFKCNKKSQVYVLPGNPISLARPRLTRTGVWDSQRKLKVVNAIDIRSQHGDKGFFEGPLLLDVVFFLPFPASIKLQELYKKQHYHVFRPDLSNLLKFIEDVAAKVLYQDDCLIVEIRCCKVYDDNPRTEFVLSEIEYECIECEHNDGKEKK